MPGLIAQSRNLLAFNVGGEFIPSNLTAPPAAVGEVDYSSSLSLELTYSRELHHFGSHSIWLDVPALVGPSHRISSANPALPTSNATFYVTPSARFDFASHRGFTPWVSAGGGYGLFETSDFLNGGTNNPTIHTHTGVLQFGGGVDVKTPIRIWKPIGLRGEFRDFFALSQPTYFAPVTGHTQHNLTVSGGLTARF